MSPGTGPRRPLGWKSTRNSSAKSSTATSFSVLSRRATSRARRRLRVVGIRTRMLFRFLFAILLAAQLLLAEYHLVRSCVRTDSTRWMTVIQAVMASR